MKLGRMAYYGALGAVGVVGIIEWPIVAALVVGHWLIKTEPQHPAVAEVGEALEDV